VVINPSLGRIIWWYIYAHIVENIHLPAVYVISHSHLYKIS